MIRLPLKEVIITAIQFINLSMNRAVCSLMNGKVYDSCHLYRHINRILYKGLAMLSLLGGGKVCHAINPVDDLLHYSRQ